MLLPKLDFHRLSYPRVFQVLSPLLPGGALVLGLLVGRPSLAGMLNLENRPNGYLTIILLTFAAYVCGYVLIHGSSAISHMVAGAIIFSQKTPPLVSEVFSKNIAWRTAAGRFLGPELAPESIEVFNREAFETARNAAQTITDETLRLTETQRVYEEHSPRLFSDFAWQNWYDAMLFYFYPNRFQHDWEAMSAMTVYHAIGWSGVFLFSVTSAFRHPLFIMVSLITTLLGLLYPLAVQKSLITNDPSHVQVMASLIGEFRKTESVKRRLIRHGTTSRLFPDS